MAILKNVEVKWCRIQEPDTKFEPVWKVDAYLSAEQAKGLVDESKKYYSKGIKLKKDEDGKVYYTFKRGVVRKKGEGNNPPPACKGLGRDPDTGKPVDFKDLIGNGSICNIQYEFYHWKNSFGEGVNCDFKGIQVVDLVSYGPADGDEFDAEDSGETPEKSQSSKDDYDDDDFS